MRVNSKKTVIVEKILCLIGDEVSDSISWLASYDEMEWQENFSIVSKSFHIADCGGRDGDGVREGERAY